jgi:futalosine hydrolase
VLVVAATARELALVEGAETLCCGIGPVEASLATMRAVSARRPTAILHFGIAGATILEPPALVIGSEAVYCDLIDPASRVARLDRQAPDPELLESARAAVPEARVLPIATTARVGGGACCEVEAMEGFGVLRAAALVGVPALEVRAISNLVQERDRSRWQIDAALDRLATALPVLIEAISRV